MANLPESSTSERLSRLAVEQKAVRQQLNALGTLRLSTAAGPPSEQVVLSGGWQVVEGAQGLWMRPFLAPPSVEVESDYFETRAAYGSHCQDASIPQAGRTLVLAGAMLWWQEALGPDPIRVGPGDTVHISPHEKHSYTALEETWCLVRLTPRLCDELPT